MVAVDRSKIDVLRDELGGDADTICFVDMAQIGRNPATIIPAWRDFVDVHADGVAACRGIGEPVWPARTAVELSECHQHEALLNLAFDAALPFHLLCPYDTSALGPSALETAYRTHPLVATASGTRCQRTVRRRRPDDAVRLAAAQPAAGRRHVGVRPPRPRDCRAFVARHAAALPADRVADLGVAVSEVTTNSVLYGGGEGVLRLWQDDGALDLRGHRPRPDHRSPHRSAAPERADTPLAGACGWPTACATWSRCARMSTA